MGEVWDAEKNRAHDVAFEKRREAKGTAFRMNTNMGQSANSQGTLFQGGKPVNEHRWPRGYSPSRMAEVEHDVPVTVAHNPDAMDPGNGSEYGHPMFNPQSDEHTRRLVREPIARSGLDLKGSGLSVHMNMTAQGINGEKGSSPDRGNVQAYYNPATKGVTVNPVRRLDSGFDEGYIPPANAGHGNAAGTWTRHSMVGVSQQRDIGSERFSQASADAVLMHEVGHHTDLTANRFSYEQQARRHGFESLRGQLESNADHAMLHTFRNDPRNQRQTHYDVHAATYAQRGSQAPEGYVDPSAHAQPKPAPNVDHVLQQGLFKAAGPDNYQAAWNGKGLN